MSNILFIQSGDQLIPVDYSGQIINDANLPDSLKFQSLQIRQDGSINILYSKTNDEGNLQVIIWDYLKNEKKHSLDVSHIDQIS